MNDLTKSKSVKANKLFGALVAVAVLGLSFMFFCCTQNPEFDEIIDFSGSDWAVIYVLLLLTKSGI